VVPTVAVANESWSHSGDRILDYADAANLIRPLGLTDS
jgi:hypothetical protein